jgi:hypothetical protein
MYCHLVVRKPMQQVLEQFWDFQLYSLARDFGVVLRIACQAR